MVNVTTYHSVGVFCHKEVHDGIVSIHTNYWGGRWDRFWNLFFYKPPSAYLLISAAKHIPVTIQAQGHSFPGGREHELSRFRVNSKSPHTVTIDGFIDGRQGQVEDVTVDQNETISVKNCGDDINGIYRGSFHYPRNAIQ